MNIQKHQKKGENGEAKFQIQLEAMFDNRLRLFEDKIENIILGFKAQLQKMEARLQEMEKQNQ